MNMMKKVLLVSFAVLLIATAVGARELKPREALGVSLIRIIADPAQYDGKRVRIKGFLRLEFEGNAIYLHREDYENGLTSNAVSIVAPRSFKDLEKYDRKYVLLEGTFERCDETQYLCLFNGYIRGIDRAEPWPPRPD
jgi:hypothetical protein